MTPAEKMQRFPAELKPNPSYQYEPPQMVVINGVRCLEIDAGFLPWLDTIGSNKSPRILK